MSRRRIRTVCPGPIDVWTPWWYRPSAFLVGISLPVLLILSFSDYSMTLSKARLFYGSEEIVVGIVFLLTLAFWSRVGESDRVQDIVESISSAVRRRSYKELGGFKPRDRIGEQFLSEKIDWVLMGIFVCSHLIFFRGFIVNPGLVAGVLGGNLELKHTFKTIPGVTTWTQITMLLAAIRGMRWAGILPGKIRLISPFHLILFGTLFVRAVLWSERLALIEAVIPFAICALPKVARWHGGRWKIVVQSLPAIAPLLLVGLFTGFESLRSWKAYSGEHSGVFQFGLRRLFTYYFEAMNTGAAILQGSGFYNEMTFPTTGKEFMSIYNGLYRKGILDVEFNNPSGIWYFCVRMGNLMVFPGLMVLGGYLGWTWRRFREGRFFGLIFPVNIILLMEIIRVYYWPLCSRAVPSTLVLILIIAWSSTVAVRLRIHSIAPGDNQ